MKQVNNSAYCQSTLIYFVLSKSRDVQKKALSHCLDICIYFKFSLWFSSIHKGNWKENLAVNQKSLGLSFLAIYYNVTWCA